MNGYTLPQISGQLEYLEKNLALIKMAVYDLVEEKKETKSTLFGSLSKTNLSLTDFKKLRRQLSSSWKKKWSL